MNTPLFSAVEEYIGKDMSRFHMPGHKGSLPLLGRAALYDVTEIPGLDELYRPRSAIAELEARFARLYKSDLSLLSAGGASLCIQTMLALALKPGDKLIAARGCHISAVNAMALLDVTPVWVFPQYDGMTGLAKPVTAGEIRKTISANRDAKAVYLTSPDYYGVTCDISSISEVCREFNVPLLVDNAHGAHTAFLSPSLHPLKLGADMCADSLHKTMPVLTGGAMLHIKNQSFTKNAKRLMSIFGSTSPGYLVMLSADTALRALENDFSSKLSETADMLSKLETIAIQKGFAVPSGIRDPLKLSLGFFGAGYTRGEFEAMIRSRGIEPEMTDDRFCVLMASPYNRPKDFERLEDFLKSIKQKPALPVRENVCTEPEQAMSLRESVFADTMEIPVEEAAFKTAGSFIAPCPPGIPQVIPGEVIDENLLNLLKRYGILSLNVVI